MKALRRKKMYNQAKNFQFLLFKHLKKKDIQPNF